MTRLVLLTLAMLALAAGASAQTLTADGFTAVGVDGTPLIHDRLGLVNDGSFEEGVCGEGSAWTCATNTSCTWILDPTPVWGFPAYDGDQCAWLGGFCSTPNSNSFCQDIYIDALRVDWRWMGYVNSACGTVSLTVDGATIWSHTMLPSEHNYGVWDTASSQWGWGPMIPWQHCGTTVNLCFRWDACPDGLSNDNMLVDYVTLESTCWDAAEDASISTVKARY